LSRSLSALALVWRAAPGWTLASHALVVVQGLLPIALLVLTKWIVDAVAAGVASPDHALAWRQILIYIIAAGAVAVLIGIAATAAATVSEIQGRVVTDAVADKIHQKASEVDIEFFENPAGHDALYRAQEEAAYRPASVVSGLNQILQHGASVLAIAALLASLEWWVAVVLLLAAAPSALVRIGFSRRFFGWTRDHTHAERRAWYYHFLLSDGGHAREIRLFGLGGLFSTRYRDIRATLRRERLRLGTRRLASDLVGQVVASTLVFGTYAFVAARALAGAISLGGFVMYFQAFQRGLASLQGLLGGLASLYEDSLFLQNYHEFLDLPARVVDPATPVPLPAPVRGSVEFERVTFRYPGAERDALTDVSIDIRAGEVVALVGENGSGKSTFVKLVCRFYDPDFGTVRIEGRDLRTVAQDEVRCQVSAIFQDFARYDLSMRENVWLGDANAPARERWAMQEVAAAGTAAESKRDDLWLAGSAAVRTTVGDVRENLSPLGNVWPDGAGAAAGESWAMQESAAAADVQPARADRVEWALEQAGARSLTGRMPAGLDTVLGRWFDEGVELSLGEWQKIALARALYREAPIVVLDEPTSGMDALAEQRFFAAFRACIAGRTGIVVSHRFSTVKMADHIVVLDGGRLAEVGSHDELVAAGGLYARMFETQARSYR